MVRPDFLKRISLGKGLTHAELEALANDLSVRRFRAGEMIFYEGDPGRVLYLIAEGRVRIYVQGESGQETSVIVSGPGDVFGEMAVIDDNPRSASAVASEDAVGIETEG